MPCLKKKADVNVWIYPKRQKKLKSVKEEISKPQPPEDGISLDGLYPVAAVKGDDDDEISFVTSRLYAAVRVGGRHGRDTWIR